jgi:signal transduction histidine kinase
VTRTRRRGIETLFRTLYAKLAFVLIALLTTVGVVYMAVVVYSTRVYQQEMIQKLHRSLAANLATEPLPVPVQQINPSMLGEWFRVFTVANPSIDLYLLNLEGSILAHSADAGQIRRRRVSLEPVRRFLGGSEDFPILGDDPRGAGRRQAFSAAPIIVDGQVRGYLYAILGSERYASVSQLLERSQVLRLSLTLLIVCSLLGLAAGMLSFRLLTNRLRHLSAAITEFQQTGRASKLSRRLNAGRSPGDELDRLEASFDQLVDRITQQVRMLEQADTVRRELIAGVSHDLRTPLTTLRGYLETLVFMEDTLSPGERRDYLESAIQHGKRLSTLIGALAELARLDAPEMSAHIEPFPLGEIVQDVVQKFALAAADRNVDLVGDFAPDLPLVSADIELIERVFENLIENALRYTPSGGTITVALVPKDTGVGVSVTDTGPGIPPEILPRIFDRFWRQTNGGGGTSEGMGLGLAITKRILELHGSAIDVQSTVGAGSTFSFTLPVAASKRNARPSS